MKKIIVSLLLIATCLCLFAESKVSAPVEQLLLGHVKTNVSIVVSINEDVLPFDLDSNVVTSREVPDSEPTAVNGLRIGSYSIVSNNTGFSITITHDKLVLFNGIPEEDQKTEIDYRLYLFTKDKDFKSCLSTGNINLTQSDYTFKDNLLAEANKSLYLSLAGSPDSLAAGDYESYITIHVVEGSV